MTARRFAVPVGDLHLSVLQTGQDDAAATLLLAGLGGLATVWNGLANDLAARGRRALAVELRGHGESSWPGDGYTFEAMAGDVIGLIETLDVAPVDVVGHSLGGRVGLEVATARPKLVRRLVLAEAPPARHAPTPAEVPPRPDEPTPFDWAVVSPIRHQARAVDPAWWDRLPEVAVPALWIAGGPSSQVPQELLAEAAARMADARLVTIDGGHSMHESRPAEFSAVVLDFLLG
jgi:pimeloyl-ACP methyl ester carboxylesterase